jgi:mannose-6-phosphate isomerase-like protein (cupin superfamily)
MIEDVATISNSGTVLPPGAGRSISTKGGHIALETESKETGGAWSLLEPTVAPGFSGPPTHWHEVTQEAFYVLEGALTLQVGD